MPPSSIPTARATATSTRTCAATSSGATTTAPSPPGTWTAPQVLSTQGFANAPNDWHLIDTGDFNGDARSDLLWRHDGGTVGTWHMNGATVISTQAFANAPLDWHIQGAADFNGDGKTDLLWRHDSGTGRHLAHERRHDHLHPGLRQRAARLAHPGHRRLQRRRLRRHPLAPRQRRGRHLAHERGDAALDPGVRQPARRLAHRAAPATSTATARTTSCGGRTTARSASG